MKDKILALRAEGKSYRQIQAILGCSKGTISYHCGLGQKDKHNQTQQNARSARLAVIANLKSAPCTDCGNTFPSECMDFDHIGKDKTNRVSQLAWQGPLQKALDEIDKCELVCSNCHRIRTKQRGSKAWNQWGMNSKGL